jgi:hypothetical protein
MAVGLSVAWLCLRRGYSAHLQVYPFAANAWLYYRTLDFFNTNEYVTTFVVIAAVGFLTSERRDTAGSAL